MKGKLGIAAVAGAAGAAYLFREWAERSGRAVGARIYGMRSPADDRRTPPGATGGSGPA